MPFKSLVVVSDLPLEGPLSADAREKHDLDFKEYADRATPWEHAKDIAAFANSLGGTLLVGSTDKPTVVHHGIRKQTAHDVRDIYEQAALMCSPTVPIDVVPINFPDGKIVVAVNVPPFPEAVVGAPEHTKDKNGKASKAEHGWRFPIRRASQTHHLKPEELPLYMNPNVRRAYVRLDAIPSQARNALQVEYTRYVHEAGRLIRKAETKELRLETASLDENALVLAIDHAVGGTLRCRVPLIDVIDVWKSGEDRWTLRLAGTVEVAPGLKPPRFEYVYLP